MAGNGQEIDFARIEADRHFAGGLHRVGMKQRAFRMRHSGDGFDRKNRAGFVVRPHDGDYGRRFVDRPFGISEVEPAALVDRDVFDLEAAARKLLAVGQHAGVFDDGGHDLVPAGAGVNRRVDRGVVALAAAAREDDFGGVSVAVAETRAEQIGHPAPRLLDLGGDAAAETVDARRIAVTFAEKRTHRLEHLRVDGGRGVVVQVNDFIFIHGNRSPPVLKNMICLYKINHIFPKSQSAPVE